MNPITYRFTLDLAKNGVQYVLSGIKTGDTNRVMEIHLTVNGTPYEIKPGTSAHIRAKLSKDSLDSFVTGLCEIKGNMIRYEITPDMLVAEGQVYADIEIGDEAGEKFATCEILMLIYKDLLGDEKPPETEFNSLIQAIAIAEGKAINNVTVTENGALLIHLNDSTKIDAGYVSPRLQVNGETNEWEISYDGEETWENTGVRATGDVSEAVSKAETAANRANEKAEKANAAAESANQAAAEARTAKDEAITAKDGADAAAGSAEEAATYANQTAYRAQIAAQDAIQATADASQAATNAENSMLADAFIDEDGVLVLKRKGKGAISVGKVTGDKGDKGDPGIADNSLSANAIKGKKSGEVVALTDVSPLEHEIKVKVSQGGATVKKYGKNYSPVSEKTWTGSWTSFKPTEPLKSGKTYVLIADVTTTSPDQVVTVYDDNAAIRYWNAGENSSLVFTVGAKDVDGLWFHAQRGYVSGSTNVATLKRFVIVEEQEPITYTADENGIVSGVIGNGESMTLLTDTAGVTIEAEYNRDTNKVIANLMEKIAALENAAAEQI